MVSPELLRRYPLFAGQSLYMVKEIALLADEMKVPAGEWLFQENEEAHKLYIIQEGAVSLCLYLYLNGRGQHIETGGTQGPGEVVGWSAVVPPHVYTLGARADKDSRLLVIDAVALRELLDDNPHHGYYLLKNLATVMGERLDGKCVQLLSLVLDKEGKPVQNPA